MERPSEKSIVSDAVLTVPNVITFARLALIPVFVWLALGPKRLGWAFAVGAVAGATDFVDGKVARHYGQVSKLGTALDPFSDRLLIGAAAAILIVRDFAPLWTVVLVIARDAAVLAAIPFLGARNVGVPPVNFIGKSATMGIMSGFGFFMGAYLADPPLDWMLVAAWSCYVPGVVLSYLSAVTYAVDVRRSLRSASEGAAAG